MLIRTKKINKSITQGVCRPPFEYEMFEFWHRRPGQPSWLFCLIRLGDKVRTEY